MTKTANTTKTAKTVKADNTLVVAEIVTNALKGDFTGYTTADVTIKANVRKALKAGIEDAIGAMDLETANTYLAAQKGCVGAKAAKVTVPVNHAEIVAKRAYLLIQAGTALLRGEAVPNGLNPEDVDNADVQAMFDKYDTSADYHLSVKSDIEGLATQKVTKSTERVDIRAHIAEVIEGAEVGTFFSVRHIASTATEAAPNGCPSDGAVAMRLFPQNGHCTLLGTLPIKPVTDPVKGLVVTA